MTSSAESLTYYVEHNTVENANEQVTIAIDFICPSPGSNDQVSTAVYAAYQYD